MMKCTECAEMVRVMQYHVGSLTKSVTDRDIYVAGSRTFPQVNVKCTDCAEMVRVRQYHVGSLTKSVKDRDIYVAGSRTTHQVNDEMY
jgi:galactitol-specific phosphotransferase system IIB component